MHTRALLGGASVVLLWLGTLAGTAWADSGSITDVHEVGNGQSMATFGATSTACGSFGYCGWFPAAWQVSTAAPCAAGGSDIVYVGTLQDSLGTQTASETFFKQFEPVKLCLFIYRDGAYLPVAETTYSAQPPPPSPTPAPPPPAPVPGPTLLSPAAGAELVAGRSVVFRVRPPDPLDLTTVEVSRSSALGPDGTLAGANVVDTDFAEDQGDGEQAVRLTGNWTKRPGVYYWQASRLACDATADCAAESEVRTLVLVAPPFAFTASAQAQQRLQGSRVRYGNVIVKLDCNRDCRVRLRGTPYFHRAGGRHVLRGLPLIGDVKLKAHAAIRYGFEFTAAERRRLTGVMRRYGPLLWRVSLRATALDGSVRTQTRYVRMTPPPLPRPAPTPAPQRSSCDPSYPTVCIPPPPPDLDCKDVPYHDFTVVGSDPHHFDRDHDGVGCES